MSMEESDDCTPPDLQLIANDAAENLLPHKSANLYYKTYDLFLTWCNTHSVKNYTENVLLAYFAEKAKILKVSTLWSTYSMLKSTIMLRHNIDISKFAKLIAFIKQKNSGYKAKKSNIFSREDLNKFLSEAPDENYLMWKVCLIFGVAGACRMDELKKMCIDDIDDKVDILIIKIPDSKTGKQRTFTVSNQMGDTINPITIYNKYLTLRPSHIQHKSLFINYRLGKCSTQVIGIHTFGKIPSLIATYLELPNPKLYTGHAFRRTSASLLCNTGADLLTLKQHGGWKSNTVAEGYVETSIMKKKDIASRILQGQGLEQMSIQHQQNSSTSSLSNQMEPIVIQNNTNCTITININN